jgi:hypothetical protein
VDGEPDPGRGATGGAGDERRRLVQSEGAPRRQDGGEQAGGVPGSAAEVDRQVEGPAGEPLQERPAGRLEQVGQQAEPPRRRCGVAEGVAANGVLLPAQASVSNARS